MTCRTRRNSARHQATPLGPLVPHEEQQARVLMGEAASLQAGAAMYRASGDTDAADAMAQEACTKRAKASDLRVRLRERQERKD